MVPAVKRSESSDRKERNSSLVDLLNSINGKKKEEEKKPKMPSAEMSGFPHHDIKKVEVLERTNNILARENRELVRSRDEEVDKMWKYILTMHERLRELEMVCTCYPDKEFTKSHDLIQVEERVKQYRVVLDWKSYVHLRKSHRNEVFLTYSFQFQERIRRRVAERKANEATEAATVSYLQELVRRGHKLSLEQVNYLKTISNKGKRFGIYECGVCYDSFHSGEIAMVEGCLHTICESCMSGYVENNLNNRILEMKCPTAMCSSFLTDSDIRNTLAKDPHQLSRYDSFLTDNYLDKQVDVVRCIRPGCGTPMIQSSKMAVMCICPKESCKFTVSHISGWVLIKYTICNTTISGLHHTVTHDIFFPPPDSFVALAR